MKILCHAFASLIVYLAVSGSANAECNLATILKYAPDDAQAIEMYNALCKGIKTEQNLVSATKASGAQITKVEGEDASTDKSKTEPPAVPMVPPGSSASSLVATTDSKKPAATQAIDQSAFFKGWGVGLAMMRNENAVVSDASVVGGLVRANTDAKWQPELLVAKHFYFHHETTEKNPGGSCLWTQLGVCPGVFLGVGFGGSTGSQVIDMIGGGFIIGFGSPVYDSSQDQAHNIGIGFGRRFNVKKLGDGISADKPLPAGETQVRYKTTDITAPFLFYTYKFN